MRPRQRGRRPGRVEPSSVEPSLRRTVLCAGFRARPDWSGPLRLEKGSRKQTAENGIRSGWIGYRSSAQGREPVRACLTGRRRPFGIPAAPQPRRPVSGRPSLRRPAGRRRGRPASRCPTAPPPGIPAAPQPRCFVARRRTAAAAVGGLLPISRPGRRTDRVGNERSPSVAGPRVPIRRSGALRGRQFPAYDLEITVSTGIRPPNWRFSTRPPLHGGGFLGFWLSCGRHVRLDEVRAAWPDPAVGSGRRAARSGPGVRGGRRGRTGAGGRAKARPRRSRQMRPGAGPAAGSRKEHET